MENPIKMDDLGVPLFLETSIYKHNLYMCMCVYAYVSVHSLSLKIFGLKASCGLQPGPNLGSHARKSCRQVSSSIASNLMENACEKPTAWWFQPVWKILQ